MTTYSSILHICLEEILSFPAANIGFSFPIYYHKLRSEGDITI